MKTGKDFENQVKKFNIKSWPIHNCTICDYHCGYVFKDNKVYYDSSCYCVPWNTIEERDFDDVANQYNIQSHPDIIKMMNKFWHFDQIKIKKI